MISTLAMGDLSESPLGPAPTLLGIAIAGYWAWALIKNYPLTKPLMRLIGVVLFVFSLSLVLGFNPPSYETQGGYGGLIGRWIADRIHSHGSSVLNVSVVMMLLVAVLGSLVLATEWFFIPIMFRLQEAAQRAAAGLSGMTPAVAGAHRMGGAGGLGGMRRMSVEEDSTADPTVPPGSYGGVSALDEENEPRGSFGTSFEAPTDEIVGRLGGESGAREGETIEPGEAGDDPNVPWYARRRARREAQRAEREAKEASGGNDAESASADDAPPTEEPVAESATESTLRRWRARHRIETPEHESEAPRAEPSPEIDRDDETRAPEAASTDLARDLSSGVDNAFDSFFGEENRAAPAAETVAEPEAASEQEPVASSPTAPQELETVRNDDDFASLFATTEKAIGHAPPAPETSLAPRSDFADEIVAATSPVSATDDRAPTESPPPLPQSSMESVVDAPVERETPTSEPVVASVPSEPEPEAVSFGRTVTPDDPEQQLFLAAGDAVVSGQRASISFLQRTLSIGYFQAAKLLDRLEKQGVIGPYTGAVSRNVTMDAATWAKVRNG